MMAAVVDWWKGLAGRERVGLVAAVGVAAAAVAWIGIFEPLTERLESRRQQVAEQRALLDWLDAVEPLARERASAPAPEPVEGSLLAAVDRSARAAGLAGMLERIEPAGDDGVRVWLTAAEYRVVMAWLVEFTRRRPLVVERLEAEPADSGGRVDVRLVLGSSA